MNYILLLYLLSISAGAFHIGSNQKEENIHSTKSIVNNRHRNNAERRILELRYNDSYPFINPSINTISSLKGLTYFYQKLSELKAGEIKRVNIVQIGDSHIQPDLISREVRSGLQDFFGDAGRGLVFPYQIARTNAPLDIKSSTTTRWQPSNISQLHARSARGISGFSLSRLNGAGNISLSLRPDINSNQQSFDYIKLFLGGGQWNINTMGNGANSYRIDQSSAADFTAREIMLDAPATGFNMRSSSSRPYFFGASLEKKNASGVLLHTIGVNGARYEQYNNEPMFWKQLPALNADLYILSLGTNEAYYNNMTEDLYINQVSEMLAKIKTINAKASILITTTAESFKNGRTNPMIERLNLALKFYCNKMGIPVWDLFEITGGAGSSKDWLKSNLMQVDKIHYQRKAYSMQGALLFDAIANGYNKYLDNQATPPTEPLSISIDELKTANK